jgi:uncharacterized protein YciI
MLWAIYCIDKPNSAPLRAEHQQRHSAYLKEKDPVIFFTGPLQSDDAADNIGSLWIIAANSRSEAQAFVDGEAFNRAGVFESVSVRRVRKGHFHPERADSK